jgi:hypothetical protein
MYNIFTPDLLAKDSDADLIAAIYRNLPDDDRKPPLVISVELVWQRQLGALASTGTLIITTARQLTTNGGNGWTGFDGGDADILDAAISSAVDEVGACMIDRFIVRAADQCKATNDEVRASA